MVETFSAILACVAIGFVFLLDMSTEQAILNSSKLIFKRLCSIDMSRLISIYCKCKQALKETTKQSLLMPFHVCRLIDQIAA